MLVGNPQNTGSDKTLGLPGGLVFIFGDPRNVLTHVYHVEGPIWIETGPLAGGPEGFFVHPRRTRGHDHAGEVVVPNIIFDKFLPGIGTHEQIIT